MEKWNVFYKFTFLGFTFRALTVTVICTSFESMQISVFSKCYWNPTHRRQWDREWNLREDRDFTQRGLGYDLRWQIRQPLKPESSARCSDMMGMPQAKPETPLMWNLHMRTYRNHSAYMQIQWHFTLNVHTYSLAPPLSVCLSIQYLYPLSPPWGS